LDDSPDLEITEADAATQRRRVRLIYAKGEAIKYISHMDEFRLWERALRRAGLPLLYKQGFNPQPHIQFAAPLGVGITGENEPIDIVLSKPVPLPELCAALAAALPSGVTLRHAEEVPLKAPALQGYVIGADYTIILYAAADEAASLAIGRRLVSFLAAATIWRERERKGEAYRYNLRPLIFELRDLGYDAVAEEQRLFLRVQQRPGATGRPDEVVAALGLDDQPRTLRRDRLYFAGEAEDSAIFAAYPVITQESISGGRLPQSKRCPGLSGPSAAQPVGRSISERAGDEFV
jgi:radical SAM-linked protein